MFKGSAGRWEQIQIRAAPSYGDGELPSLDSFHLRSAFLYSLLRCLMLSMIQGVELITGTALEVYGVVKSRADVHRSLHQYYLLIKP